MAWRSWSGRGGDGRDNVIDARLHADLLHGVHLARRPRLAAVDHAEAALAEHAELVELFRHGVYMAYLSK